MILATNDFDYEVCSLDDLKKVRYLWEDYHDSLVDRAEVEKHRPATFGYNSSLYVLNEYLVRIAEAEDKIAEIDEAIAQKEMEMSKTT